jgi:hypothetical protein
MHWPQITMIVFAGVALGTAAAKDGQPKTDNHSVWTTLIATGVEFWLL